MARAMQSARPSVGLWMTQGIQGKALASLASVRRDIGAEFGTLVAISYLVRQGS